MGKDLKGKELGKGLSQRPDGRYLGRAQVACKSIALYSWNLKELKHSLVDFSKTRLEKIEANIELELLKK